MTIEQAAEQVRPEQGDDAEVFIFPASFAQQRLWYLQQLNPSSVAYSVPAPFRVSGRLDVGVLECTINEIVRRHEALRTTFMMRDDEPSQVIALARTLRVTTLDLSGVGREAAERRVEDWLRAEAQRPFDLERGPLLRVSVLRLDPQSYVLVVNIHHIVSDGWSLGVLMREVSEIYAVYLAGQAPALPELAIQYADYTVWQREWLDGGELARQLAYWRKELDGAPTVIALPVDFPRPISPAGRGRQHVFALPADLAERLRRIGRRHGATLYMVLLAGFYALLGRYTGQQQLLVGSPIAGRTRRETEELIGLFVNTLVLRGDLRGMPTFEALLRRVKETTLGAYAHQDVPFEKLVEAISPVRESGRSPLFQVMFAMQNAPIGPLQLGPARFEQMALDTGTSKFDLTLSIEEQANGGIEGYWEYNSDLFEHATVARMASHYTALLEAAIVAPGRPVALIEILSEPERQQLGGWNETHRAHDVACLHERFELAARRDPEAIAVTGRCEPLTYAELNARANRWGRYLRARQVRPDERVAIVMGLCPEAIVAVLAVLKAGGAYVPIDPGFPPERIGDILERSGARLALTTLATAPIVPSRDGIDVLALDDAPEMLARQSDDDLVNRSHPVNAAYVIYTSGSTGRPKGVVVEHRQAIGYLHGITRRLGLEAGAHYAMVQPLAVDSCKTVLLPWMCLGGTLHLLPRTAALDPHAVAAYFRQARMDVLKIAPSHLAGWLESCALDGLLPHGDLVLGGEGTRWDWLRRSVLPRLPATARVHIHYGPTETTVGVLTQEIQSATDTRGRLAPLGKPLDNVVTYIASPELMQLPVGVVGELLIGGSTVARGYLGRPDLTAEKFVPDPFSPKPGARLYRSGDLARRLADGAIEFLGRSDHQVKVRGFRIELGEIETALLEQPGVRRAAVLARENHRSEHELAAYVMIAAADDLGEVRKLREALTRRLPSYMIPASISALPSWPMTAQGKLDARALQAVVSETAQALALAGPRSRTEAQLMELWSALLQIGAFGVHDSFFDLGGHSLLLIRMLAAVRRTATCAIDPARFLERPTIAHLAALVDARGTASPSRRLVRLQPDGHHPPLAVVHPVGGDVACYAQLATALGTDHPLLAFQLGDAAPAETVGELARIYADELHGASSGRGIWLGGWSFGGLVAFEMARQLAATAQRPLGLVLFDSYPPELIKSDEGEGLIERFAFDLAATLGWDVAAEMPRFGQLNPDAQQRDLRHRLLAEGVIHSDEEFDRRLRRFERHVHAARHYRPRRTDQDIVLFAARCGAGLRLADRWSDWTSGRVDVHLVDGDHHSMLRQPVVVDVAARLKEHFSHDHSSRRYLGVSQ